MPFCIIVKYTLNTNNNGTGANADRLELLTNSQLLIEWLYIEQISWGQMGLHTQIKVSQSSPYPVYKYIPYPRWFPTIKRMTQFYLYS